jgi:UDP-N-acetylglucosamine 4,6-dehydratase
MSYVKNKTVLVTGGTGSFGLFIVQRLLRLGVRKVRVLSRDEKKHYDMRIQFSGENRLELMTGDIRDHRRVKQAVNGCHLVFQAAAMKHVNNCEMHPYEACRTNIEGVQNVIDASIEAGVERFITVSTDKAVKPVNVMGMTKAIQERLVIAANYLPGAGRTRFACVRYGNVMSSRGSAIPFFRSLIEKGRPITITHEEMTRFLLTLDDAIDLVMYAADHMRGGEIYVKKAPSVRIVDLARCLCESAGRNFDYQVIGMIPGEKLHEILISEEELPRTRELPGYFIVSPFWARRPKDPVGEEYESSSELIEEQIKIRRLLARSDAEFERYGLKQSVFLK